MLVQLPRTPGRSSQGFTLIELLVVFAIVALLLSIVTPRYFGTVDKARETVLRATLQATRDALDKYYGDKGKYPERLEQLVEERYLRALPRDPITESTNTWVTTPPRGADTVSGGVANIRSGAPGKGSDGTNYGDW